MHLVVGLEERGSFVRWTPFSRLMVYSTVIVIERVTVVTGMQYATQRFSTYRLWTQPVERWQAWE